MNKSKIIKQLLQEFVLLGYPSIKINIGTIPTCRHADGMFIQGGEFILKRGLKDLGVKIIKESVIIINDCCLSINFQFTLAHELGHFVQFLKGTKEKDQSELIADNFAKEFLENILHFKEGLCIR
jgi:Zn-dependent peptidase ImmA (M78 family)